jgi:hypothetical protein
VRIIDKVDGICMLMMIVKYGTDTDVVLSRNVDKTKKTYKERLVLYSIIIKYEIFPERRSNVLLRDYSVFYASFNPLLYFFVSTIR